MNDIRRVVQAVVGIAFLGAFEHVVEVALGGRGGPVPAMIGAFAGLSLLRTLRPSLAQQLIVVFRPAISFLVNWMPLFFTPAAVNLPAIPLPGSRVLGSALLLIVGGFVATLAFVAALSSALQRRWPAGPTAAPVAPDPVKAPGASGLLACWSLTLLGGTLVSAWHLRDPAAVAPVLVAGTVTAWLTAQRLPVRLRAWLQPIVICAVGVHLLLAATSLGLDAYLTHDLTKPGAGDLLLWFLNPAVVALGFQLDERRALLRDNLLHLSATIGISALGAMFLQAAAARALGLPQGWALALVPRSVTMPIALPLAKQLGADMSITASAVVVTGMLGAIVGKAFLDRLGAKSSVARGLAIGVSSHTLGTAAIAASEPETGAIAAVAFVMFASATALLLALPPLEMLVRKLAGQ